MKNCIRFAALCGIAGATPLFAGVVINEIFINPPGSFDDTREFIELAGPPGMKLDGYAIASVNGVQQKFYPLGSIPPAPVAQEIDELFSLDGLALGANGLLVLGHGIVGNYSTLLSDSNFHRTEDLWNGLLDTPGNLENDGANTFMLIRNRPGVTQADPSNPAGLRWGKDIVHDGELITPVTDPQDGIDKDQYGDGNLDKGDPDNISGNTLDLKGASTPVDVSDDLEIVDEVSYEHDRGWEYDNDGRHSDVGGSTIGGLPERRVHALDDPQGLNPDVLTRVDYRTKGAGWTPAPGATGQMGNGNNWQDTATEQWIRGESLTGGSGQGSSPFFYYDVASNSNPDAIQPYMTQTPLWLHDGSGSEFNFTTAQTYQIMAGRMNPLAVAIIPGDADRDGDADADDIAKVAAVFGDEDWIFSNSYSSAPEGDSGDPATQTRPWDVDATGDNGIEASDLQWTLNFQGDTTGHVVGRRYDSTTPAATGVFLNPSLPVVCTVSLGVSIPSGHTLTTLQVGDTVELTVSAQVTSGANNTAGQQNGVMQFVNDLEISTGGVIRATSVLPLGAFAVTRPGLAQYEGVSGDLGVSLINGYTTSFTQGVTASANLYRVTLMTVGEGTANITLSAATATRMAASTPRGLKVGHTDNNGNPNAATYPATINAVVSAPGCPNAGCEVGDLDGDCTISITDLSILLAHFGTPSGATAADGDTDNDGDVDITDLSLVLSVFGRNCN